MMTAHRKQIGTGFTLIELAVVVVIVAVLATALLKRVIFYQEQAEKVAMEQTLGIVRSALHLQIANLLVKGDTDGIARLADQNPMTWLSEKPSNYLGEYYTPKTGMIAPGNWYYDLHSKNLIYLVNNSEHLHTAAGEGKQIRYRAKLVKDVAGIPDANPGGPAVAQEKLAGVILEPVVAYRWF